MKGVLVLVLTFVLVGIIQCADDASTSAPTTTEKPPVDCDVDPDVSGEAVLLPNPNNCETYYVCVGLDPILMPCPIGLHFNPELKVCDWPDRANCTLQAF